MPNCRASSKAGAAKKETPAQPWASSKGSEPAPESPEAGRKRLVRARAHIGRFRDKMRPGQYPFEVVKRVALGVYADGFIHAGNLAYLALMTVFPFIIVAAAVAHLFGQTEGGARVVRELLQT